MSNIKINNLWLKLFAIGVDNVRSHRTALALSPFGPLNSPLSIPLAHNAPAPVHWSHCPAAIWSIVPWSVPVLRCPSTTISGRQRTVWIGEHAADPPTKYKYKHKHTLASHTIYIQLRLDLLFTGNAFMYSGMDLVLSTATGTMLSMMLFLRCCGAVGPTAGSGNDGAFIEVTASSCCCGGGCMKYGWYDDALCWPNCGE